MSRALINNMSVEDFLNNMFEKEQRGEDIREDRELWYDHTTEWKYSDYDIIESVAKYVDKGGANYKGEFYKEIYNIIDCGWTLEEMVESVFHYAEINDMVTRHVVNNICYDIVQERDRKEKGHENNRAFLAIAIYVDMKRKGEIK